MCETRQGGLVVGRAGVVGAGSVGDPEDRRARIEDHCELVGGGAHLACACEEAGWLAQEMCEQCEDMPAGVAHT